MRLSRKILFDTATSKTELLSTPVCELGLRLPGSLLRSCIDRALDDVRNAGVIIDPFFYLSDGYGCVQGTANVGLGFWDANDLLREVHHDVRGYTRDEMDLVLLLKHEIGHAFCYSHKLFQLPEFRDVFSIKGNFFATYPDHERHRVDPYSLDHVNPVNDHYAQKHPDDDFAETFATFADRTEAWRERYRNRAGALRKIAFVAKVVADYGTKAPVDAPGSGPVDVPVEEIRKTVAQFFRISRSRYLRAAAGYLDDDLRRTFRIRGRTQRQCLAATTLLRGHRKFIEASVVRRLRLRDPHTVSDLLDKIRSRVKALGLVYLVEEEHRALAELHGLVLHKALLFQKFGTFRDR
jgi:hypothetical protein